MSALEGVGSKNQKEKKGNKFLQGRNGSEHLHMRVSGIGENGQERRGKSAGLDGQLDGEKVV